jgi:hypothetical protein
MSGNGLLFVGKPEDYSRQVVSALSGVPRAEILAQRKKHSWRGTFDRGDLKEGAVGGRYSMERLSNPFAMWRLQELL